MQASRVFEQTQLYRESNATAQLFDIQAEQLFEAEQIFGTLPETSSIEVHYESLEDCDGFVFVENPSQCRARELQKIVLAPLDVRPRSMKPGKEPPCDRGYPRFQNSIATSRADLERLEKASRNRFRMWSVDPELLLHAKNASQRYSFLHQRHTWSRLCITAKLFQDMMSVFCIIPQFKDFVLLFGAKSGELEVGPPPLRFVWFAGNKKLGNPTFDGFREDFACLYGFRYVDLNNRHQERPWSLRQTAVYHEYHARSRSSTWIIISPSQEAKRCINKHIYNCQDSATINPFEIHVLILDLAIANWRPYITYLSAKISQKSDEILVGTLSVEDSARLLESGEGQQLKDLEDEITDIRLALDSAADTIQHLLKNYRRFCKYFGDATQDLLDHEFDIIDRALDEKQRDVDDYRRKIDALRNKAASTTRLLSSLLDIGNGASLKQLAQESGQENAAMRKLAQKSTEDAAAVKVLTIITLIYLPASVVLNFFSTQFVTQEEEGGVNSVVVLSNAWLFGAISGPLTVGTVFIWWLWVRLQRKTEERSWKSLRRYSLLKILEWRKASAKNFKRSLTGRYKRGEEA